MKSEGICVSVGILLNMQVYNDILHYARTLNPPIELDISTSSIPPEIIISYMRKISLSSHAISSDILCKIGVLFTGKGKPVDLDENGQPILQHNGSVRMGRELAESTFRKHYHALRTLHVHFQKESDYKVSYLGIEALYVAIFY